VISLHRSATDSHSESLNRTSWNPRAARVPGRSFLGLPGVVADGNTELRGRVAKRVLGRACTCGWRIVSAAALTLIQSRRGSEISAAGRCVWGAAGVWCPSKGGQGLLLQSESSAAWGRTAGWRGAWRSPVLERLL
jgi:hypothetical protein